MFENQFFVLDDAKHVIGVDPSDARNLILENIETGKAEKFRWRESSDFFITTLLYDEETGYLYTGDSDGHLQKYKMHAARKSCERVRDYGNLGISRIYSSHRFLNFLFFGIVTVKSKS